MVIRTARGTLIPPWRAMWPLVRASRPPFESRDITQLHGSTKLPQPIAHPAETQFNTATQHSLELLSTTAARFRRQGGVEKYG